MLFSVGWHSPTSWAGFGCTIMWPIALPKTIHASIKLPSLTGMSCPIFFCFPAYKKTIWQPQNQSEPTPRPWWSVCQKTVCYTYHTP
eukprot:264473-Pelagomonas_calceolata.AAC.4